MSDKYDGGDRYLDSDTGVLRNKLGIAYQDELDRAEAMFVVIALFEHALEPIPEPISGPDFSYLMEIHGRLFCEIYDWAGQIRDVDISKGSTRFANFHFIEKEGARITTEMTKKNWLGGLSHDGFADQAAYYFGELNALHPFREGNGRALREYFRYLAERAGHSLTWEGLSRDEMIKASVSAYQTDHRLLRDIFLKQMTCCE